MDIENKLIFSRNLKKYIVNSGKDRKEIARALSIPYSTLTDWVNANKYPRINNIEKMADYFGVSKSDLIEDFEQKKKDNDAMADIIVKLRMNKELLEVVDKVVSLDNAQISSLKHLLNTFI
jgi:transcriptional regulator with XRE-family HTH domain